MADGVAEVENFAQATLTFVARNDGRLVAERLVDDATETIGVASENRRHRGLERRDHRRIHDRAVLDHLGEAFAKLALGQRRQCSDICDNQARLVERADQVFRRVEVDAGLAAEGGIDLRRHRSGYLDDRETAQIGRRGEAGEVADDAAAEREDRACTVERGGREPVVNLLERGERFARLAGRDLDGRRGEARGDQCGGGARAVEARDVGVGDERRAAGRQAGRAREFTEAVEEVGANVHRMRISAEFYAEGIHDVAAYSARAEYAAASGGGREDSWNL